MAKNSNRRKILAGNNNASAKWGFDSPSGSVLTSVPKLQGQYFVKFYHDGSEVDTYSSKVKMVSEVVMNVDHTTTDQYGKRIYTPTRVDFAPITLTMYDVVDGSTFKMASDIYQKYFKNNLLSDEARDLDSTIADVNSGLRIGPTLNQQNHYFTKIEIFHFFGQSESQSPLIGYYGEPSQTDIATSKIQKITIINPLVTSISFDSHDYSASDVRTINFTLQPENVFIKSDNVEVRSPDWLSKGMDIISDVLLKSGIVKFDEIDYSTMKKLANADASQLATVYAGLEALGIQTQADDVRFLQEFPEDAFTPVNNSIKYGTVPSFGNLVSNTPGFGNYGGNNLLDVFQDELINSVFNGTKFSLKNVGKNVLQGFLGNKGLSDIHSLTRTSTSKYGFVGDIVRDNVRGALLGDNRESATGSVIPPFDTMKQTNNYTVPDFTQQNIGNVRSASQIGIPQEIEPNIKQSAINDIKGKLGP